MTRFWRRTLKYGLCVAVFAGAVLGALELSRPPDPAARLRRPSRSAGEQMQVQASGGDLVVSEGRRKHRLRLYATDQGIAAAEVPPNDRQAE
jgi:hypothetical protein